MAPKISGEFMNEVCQGDWEYITGDLVINVYDTAPFDTQVVFYWTVKYKDEYLSPTASNEDSAQKAADSAVKFLHGLRNVINYIKQFLTSYN